MPKILSQSGVSLADTYDIEGSIVGVENLDANNVSLVHEMGSTIFAERLETNIIRMNPGPILQSIVWVVTLVPPDGANRIVAVSLVANFAARVGLASLAIENPLAGRECPIWSFDSANDAENSVHIDIEGAGVTTETLLVPGVDRTPIIVTRTNSTSFESDAMGTLTFRGSTLAFGAGDVTPLLFVLMARANRATPAPGEPSAHGLPVPSW